MAIRMGRWDCGSCGKKGVLGPEVQCPNCSAPRPKDLQFYLATDAEIIENEAKLKDALAGADWVCSHCLAHNKTTSQSCYSCDSPRDEIREGDKELEEKTHYFDEEKEDTPDFIKDFRRAPYKDWRQYGFHRLYNGEDNPYPKALQWLVRNFNKLAVTLMTALAALASFVWTTSVEVPIDSFDWERSIYYDEFKPVVEEDWQMPRNAVQLEAFEAIHHHNQVFVRNESRTRTKRVQVGTEQYKCGTKDLGNGYFQDVYCNRPVYENQTERYEEPIYNQVPVYQTKYRYRIKKWVKAETPLQLKRENHRPQWPDDALLQDRNIYREKQRTEAYYLSIKMDDEIHRHRMQKEFWLKLRANSTLKAKKYRLWGKYIGLTEGLYQD